MNKEDIRAVLSIELIVRCWKSANWSFTLTARAAPYWILTFNYSL